MRFVFSCQSVRRRIQRNHRLNGDAGYIYNDDKGEDISVVEIPDDMKDDAELYRTELVEKICELDDDLMLEYLEVKNLLLKH